MNEFFQFILVIQLDREYRNKERIFLKKIIWFRRKKIYFYAIDMNKIRYLLQIV